MSLAKIAQEASEEKFVIGTPPDDSLYVSDIEEDYAEADELHGKGEVVLEVGEEEPLVKEFEFTLPLVPGGESQDDLDDLEVEEEEEEIQVEEPDLWDWKARGSLQKFPEWLQLMKDHIPTHSGYDTAGLERVISYLQAIDKEISKAVRSDMKGELDMKFIQKARDELQDGCERCVERLEKILNMKKKKKKAEVSGVMVKEAQKIAGVKGIVITVPLLISRIARVCINGMVSGGHDIEDMFKKQAEMYKLSTREKAELLQLLEDMGYPMRRDRGIHPDEEIDTTKSDNYDWNALYPA